MVRIEFVLVLLAILCFALSSNAADPELNKEVKSYYKKCPCKCYYGKKEKLAYYHCKSYKYNYFCKVSSCYPDKYGYGHYYGKWCCDDHKPPIPQPKCPCECVDYHVAVKQCKHKKYCELSKCDDKHHHYGYGYKYKCCGKHGY